MAVCAQHVTKMMNEDAGSRKQRSYWNDICFSSRPDMTYQGSVNHGRKEFDRLENVTFFLAYLILSRKPTKTKVVDFSISHTLYM